MANINVYIDGFNLYYGALKDSPFRWLDLAALCHQMLPNDNVQTIKYFTAQVSARPHDPQQPSRQQTYLRALRTIPNVVIVFGQFRTHSTRMVLTGTKPPQKVWVDKTSEKGSDVNLAAHLIHDGYQKRFETAVLVTNDSDLKEPVRIVRRELNLPIGILNPHQFHSCTLKEHATFVKRIRQSDIAAAQFPEELTDKAGKFHKPAVW